MQPDQETPAALNAEAIGYPLRKLAAELDKCSPELRRLLKMAMDGANGGKPQFSAQDRQFAKLRLGEAVSSWTKEAKASRKAVTLAAFQPPAAIAKATAL